MHFHKKSFSIRDKVAFAVFIAVAVLASALYAISSHVLPISYEKIERDGVLKNLERVNDTIENMYVPLGEKATDWSNWDDSYNFALDHNQDFIDENLKVAALKNLNINGMFFLDTTGKSIFTRMIDLDTVTDIDSASALSYVESHPEVSSLSGIDGTVKGILPFQEGPFIFVTKPLVSSSHEGPVRGALIFGKFLTKDVVASISKLTHLNVEIFLYGDNASPADVKKAEKSMDQNTLEPIVVPLSKTEIAGYAVVRDYYGKPFLLTRVTSARTVYNQGLFTINFFRIVTIVLLFLFGALLLLVLELWVILRFTSLSQAVRNISKGDDLSVRVKVGSLDEIGELAVSINGLLDKVVSASEAEQKSNQKVKEADEELRKRLEELEKMNKFMVDREVRMTELKNEMSRLKKGQ